MQSLPYSGLSRPFPRNPDLTRPLYVLVIYFWPKSLAYSTPLTQSLPYSGLNRPFPRNPYLTRPLYVLYSAIVMKSFFYSLFGAHERALEFLKPPMSLEFTKFCDLRVRTPTANPTPTFKSRASSYQKLNISCSVFSILLLASSCFYVSENRSSNQIGVELLVFQY